MRHVMRLVAFASLALLSGSVSIAAQSVNYGGAARMKNIYPPYSQSSIPPYNPHSIVVGKQAAPSCPVSLRAQHGADGSIRKVDKSRPEGIAQLLHLILTSKDSRQIAEARLLVHGVSPKARLSHADARPDAADAMRNVTVRLKSSAENEVSGNAWVPGMSTVLQVELNAVTFTDGGVMRFGPADGCRFTPELLMLVAAD